MDDNIWSATMSPNLADLNMLAFSSDIIDAEETQAFSVPDELLCRLERRILQCHSNSLPFIPL